MRRILFAMMLTMVLASCCTTTECEENGHIIFLTFQEMAADTTTILDGREITIKDSSGNAMSVNELKNPTNELIGFIFFASDQSSIAVDFDGVIDYDLSITTEVLSSDECCETHAIKSFSVNGESTECTDEQCRIGGNITLIH